MTETLQAMRGLYEATMALAENSSLSDDIRKSLEEHAVAIRGLAFEMFWKDAAADKPDEDAAKADEKPEWLKKVSALENTRVLKVAEELYRRRSTAKTASVTRRELSEAVGFKVDYYMAKMERSGVLRRQTGNPCQYTFN